MASGSSCIKGKVTVNQCPGLSTLIPNCNVIDFTGNQPVCDQCSNGYHWESSECKPNHCTGQSCDCDTGYLKPQGGSYCTVCDCVNGYVASGSNCVIGSVTVSQCSGLSTLIPNCKIINFTGGSALCSECNSGYHV